MSIEDVIRNSMPSRRPLALCYGGDTGPPRIVHAHVLYRSANGKVCLDGYQVDGPSSSATALPIWRSFDVARISEATVLDGTFDLASGFDPASPRYRDGCIAHV